MKAPEKARNIEGAHKTSSFFGKAENKLFFSKENAIGKPFFNSTGIHSSLATGKPADPYGEKAGQVSQQAVSGFEQTGGIQQKPSFPGLRQLAIQPLAVLSSLSRKLQPALAPSPGFVQAKCAECEENEKVQEQSGKIHFAVEKANGSPPVDSYTRRTQSGGGPMNDTPTVMASSFGENFNSVRIHAHSGAVQMSKDLNASSFTGSNFFFNKGRDQPTTKQSANLLAHELTQTVQQDAAGQNKQVTRFPYAQLSSIPARACWSSISGNSMPSSSLYQKEIARFKKEVPHEDMMHPQKLLQANNMNLYKVQMDDNSKSLRKHKGKTPPPATPKLTKKTVPGKAPKGVNCGGFSWTVQWELDSPSPAGGWVIQKVNVNRSVKDCKEKNVPVSGGLNPAWYPIWEAWKVNKGQKVTTYAETGDLNDDTYGSAALGNDTKGTIDVTGGATYYEGLSLPAGFKVTNKAPAWILPVTTTDPAISGGSGAISHNITATWDCCTTDKSTKLSAV